MRTWYLSERTADSNRRTPTVVRPGQFGYPPSPTSKHLHGPWIHVIESSAYDAEVAKVGHLRQAIEAWLQESAGSASHEPSCHCGRCQTTHAMAATGGP